MKTNQKYTIILNMKTKFRTSFCILRLTRNTLVVPILKTIRLSLITATLISVPKYKLYTHNIKPSHLKSVGKYRQTMTNTYFCYILNIQLLCLKIHIFQVNMLFFFLCNNFKAHLNLLNKYLCFKNRGRWTTVPKLQVTPVTKELSISKTPFLYSQHCCSTGDVLCGQRWQTLTRPNHLTSQNQKII